MLVWNPEISMGNVILGSLLVLSVVGLIMNYFQLRKGLAQKRAEFLITLSRDYLLDPDLVELYYDIDYERQGEEAGQAVVHLREHRADVRHG
jgi:hypothetical protein